MHALFWDTETDGLPKNYSAPPSQGEYWPRITQLAWCVVDTETGFILQEVCELIKPDGWVIPRQPFWIEHGFSTEKNEAEGIPMPEMLDRFIEDLNHCGVMVAHNISFDGPITAAEMYRYGRKAAGTIPKICTMRASTNIVKAKHKNGRAGNKWPTLMELHHYLFQTGFDGAHDAGADVRAGALCFMELLKRGHVSLP